MEDLGALEAKTHRLPFTRHTFSSLYSLTKKEKDYRDWLQERGGVVRFLSSIEKDFWTIVGGGWKSKFKKLDEVKIAGVMAQEKSIRGDTLIDQLTLTPSLTTIYIDDIRLAHPLALEKVHSQQRKFSARTAALESWKKREGEKEDTLPFSLLQELIPSSDPIIITVDPLQLSLYVSASGNGRTAALKEVLGGGRKYKVEVIAYLQ